MIGAIIGDIVGSRFEWNNIKQKEFELFTPKCFVTDDSVMTLAVAKALLESRKDPNALPENAIRAMQEEGRRYPGCSYGGRFREWIFSSFPKPYNSFGNGAAMRVSPCAWAAESMQQAIDLSRAVTEVTHNHREGVKGAEATTVAIYMARCGYSMDEIRDVIHRKYYPMNFTLDQIRPVYRFNETCQDTVPQALMAFFESNSFEDALRNAISLGGDSDTLAAITCSAAEAYYGVPDELRRAAGEYLDAHLLGILQDFEAVWPVCSKASFF